MAIYNRFSLQWLLGAETQWTTITTTPISCNIMDIYPFSAFNCVLLASLTLISTPDASSCIDTTYSVKCCIFREIFQAIAARQLHISCNHPHIHTLTTLIQTNCVRIVPHFQSEPTPSLVASHCWLVHKRISNGLRIEKWFLFQNAGTRLFHSERWCV